MITYSRRAWCAFEYIVFLKHPSIVRIAKIFKAEAYSEYHVKWVSLPTNDESTGIETLVKGIHLIKNAVQTNNKRAFAGNFNVSFSEDLDLIWEAFLSSKNDLFSYERHREDFFTKSYAVAAMNAQRLPKEIEIYEEEAHSKMEIDANFSQYKPPEQRKNDCACSMCLVS